MRSIRATPRLIALLAALLLAPPALADRGATTENREAATPREAAAPGESTPEESAAGEGSEEEEWDVDDPPGDFYEVELDTDEGTWMSLDVSPDGSEIVFDLFGDLYSLPIEGGE